MFNSNDQKQLISLQAKDELSCNNVLEVFNPYPSSIFPYHAFGCDGIK